MAWSLCGASLTRISKVVDGWSTHATYGGHNLINNGHVQFMATRVRMLEPVVSIIKESYGPLSDREFLTRLKEAPKGDLSEIAY